MRFSIVCVFFIIVLPSITNAQPTHLKPPCEFAVLVDGSQSVNDEDPGNFQKLVDLIKKVPDYILISEQDSRVAVIQFGSGARVELDLTGDESKVRGLSVQFMGGSNTDTHLSLQAAKDQVFKSARENVIKTAVLMTDGKSTDMTAAKEAAEALRKDGTITFALFVGEAYKNDKKIKDHIDDLAGDPERVANVNNFDKLTEKLIEEIRKYIECNYEELCKFNDGRTKCENIWDRRVESADQDRKCVNEPPKEFKKTCDDAGCNEQCDKWKWEKPNCDGNNAGEKVTVKRAGSMPDRNKAVFEKCPREKEVVCPTMAPTTTVPVTSSVSSSPTSMTTATSSSLASSMESTATDETGTTDRHKSTVAKTSDSLQSNFSGTTTGDGSQPRGLKDETAGSETGDGDKGLDTWIIILIVGLIVCALIAVIVAAMVITRKKNRAKKAKERAAAMKIKSDQENADKLARSKGSRSLFAKSISVQSDPSVKTADHSMGVSMVDGKTRKLGVGGKSTMSIFGRTPKKPKGQSKSGVKKAPGKMKALDRKKSKSGGKRAKK